jgi:hypothetical protein
MTKRPRCLLMSTESDVSCRLARKPLGETHGLQTACHASRVGRGNQPGCNQRAKKSRINVAISFAWVSSAKWPVSKK